MFLVHLYSLAWRWRASRSTVKKMACGKAGRSAFENEQRIVGVRAQDADRFSAFSFVLNPRGQGAHIIELTGAFGTFLQPTGQSILRCLIGFWVSLHAAAFMLSSPGTSPSRPLR